MNLDAIPCILVLFLKNDWVFFFQNSSFCWGLYHNPVGQTELLNLTQNKNKNKKSPPMNKGRTSLILVFNISGLPRVEISSRRTIFWRYQKGKPKEYLATIEAIYYFLVDFHSIVLNKKYNGEYDNILFLFKFMYDKIHELYDHDSLRAYTRD